MKTNLKIIVLLFIVCLNGFAQLNIKEGKDAVYVFISNQSLSEQTPMGSVTGALLYRSLAGEKEFKPLGRIQAPLTRENFVRAAGPGALRNIMMLKQLKSEDAAWEYVKANPELEKYGMIALNMDFLVAMGAAYKDTEAKKAGKTVKYKVEYITTGNKKENEVEGSLTLGVPPVIEKPVLRGVQETDSSVSVSWSLNPERSPEALMGEIWMQEKANAGFKKVGFSLANQVDNDIVFNWMQRTTPDLSYSFYLVPVTLVGLEGPKSDTTYLISQTFRNLPQVPIAQIKDTLGGILVSWDKIAHTELMSAILVERSKNPEEGFILLDTLSAAATSYYDQRILPNTLYHYRFRVLGLRQNISEPSAYVSHQMLVESRDVEAPENVVLDHDKEGNITLAWDRVLSPEVSGYQVFRAPQGNDDFELVSNLLDGTAFTDTTIKSGRLVYKYHIKALNFENKVSGPSDVVFGSPKKLVLPPTPYNVESYSEPGRVTLRWKDMVSYDESVVSYSVYRKEVSKGAAVSDGEQLPAALRARGFQKLNTLPVVEVLFADRSIQPGREYQYAVTATDMFGNEGPALGTVGVSPPVITVRVPEIYVRSTSKGIEITWNDLLEPKADRYDLYVRLQNEKVPRKLGEAGPGKEQFTDSRATAGQLYFYSMKVRVNGRDSNFGNEKSVRK